jgi:hypothetical protein
LEETLSAPTVPTDVLATRRAELAQEIARLREVEEDTLDRDEHVYLASLRAAKERELAALGTSEGSAPADRASAASPRMPLSHSLPVGDRVATSAVSASEVERCTAPRPTPNADAPGSGVDGDRRAARDPNSLTVAGADAGSGDEGGDPDTDDHAEGRAEQAGRPTGNGTRDMPPPNIGVHERGIRDIAGDATAALLGANDPPWAFVRGGQLTKLRRMETAQPQMEAVTFDQLQRRLHEIADFRGKHNVPRTVPPAVVKYLLNDEAYPGIPPLAGVVTMPVLRADGSVLRTPGYDPASRLFLHQAPSLIVPQIPDAPTQADVFRARDFVLDFIAEFPFVSQADRANFLAAWLTPLIRPVFTGCTPLLMFDKPTAGTGATLLAQLIKATAEGGTAIDGLPDTDAELEKRITALLQAGAPTVIWDNIEAPLMSPVLARLLTSQAWQDRILGQTRTATFPNRTLWMVTGNNVPLGGDLPRRVVLVRLDAGMTHPERRVGFTHVIPNAILEQRGPVIAALLTLARGWFVAGCPPGTTFRADNFAEWARVCSGILTHADVDGFLTNRSQLTANVEDGRLEWRGFVEHLGRRVGSEPFTTAQVANWLADDDALLSVAPADIRSASKGKDDFTKVLGQLLSRQRDRVFDTTDARRLRFTRAANTHTNTATWRIVEVEQKEAAGA